MSDKDWFVPTGHIQNIIDDIENGYIRDMDSVLQTLKELIE